MWWREFDFFTVKGWCIATSNLRMYWWVSVNFVTTLFQVPEPNTRSLAWKHSLSLVFITEFNPQRESKAFFFFKEADAKILAYLSGIYRQGEEQVTKVLSACILCFLAGPSKFRFCFAFLFYVKHLTCVSYIS